MSLFEPTPGEPAANNSSNGSLAGVPSGESGAQPRKSALAAAAALVAAGALLLGLRVQARQAPAAVSEDAVWRVNYDVTFRPEQAGARIRFSFPSSTPAPRLIRESFTQSGITVTLVSRMTERGREAVGRAQSELAETRFAAQFDLRPGEPQERDSGLPAALTSAQRLAFLESESGIQVGSPQVKRVLARLNARTSEQPQLLRRIFHYCVTELRREDPEGSSDAAGAIQEGGGTRLGRARAMAALCRAAEIPARMVTGFILQDTPHAEPHTWVEALLKGRWTAFDPVLGHFGSLPRNFLPVRYDGVRIVSSSRADTERRFSIRSIPSADAGWLAVVDLTRLPRDTQEALAHLMLLAVATVITSIFRNIVGVPTFSAFGPSLLAVSFASANWLAGTIVFVSVMTIGLASRAVLAPLGLRKVSRLSTILVLALGSLVMVISLLDYSGLTPTSTGVLLPMVVLTMFIERFYAAAEEKGAAYGLKVFACALGVAAAALLVVRIPHLAEFLLAFPESLLLVAAALLGIGSYRGPSWVDLGEAANGASGPFPGDDVFEPSETETEDAVSPVSAVTK